MLLGERKLDAVGLGQPDLLGAREQFASQGTGLLRSFVGARSLGPAVFGVWLGLRLIVDYGVLQAGPSGGDRLARRSRGSR
mgnify:CR=1 FL=1